MATTGRDPSPGSQPLPPGRDAGSTALLLNDPVFRDLVRERSRLAVVVVGLMVVVYFGYILLLVAAPGLLRVHVTPVITAGFPLGLGVMVVTFGLVLFYVRRSARRCDALIARLQPGAAR